MFQQQSNPQRKPLQLYQLQRWNIKELHVTDTNIQAQHLQHNSQPRSLRHTTATRKQCFDGTSENSQDSLLLNHRSELTETKIFHTATNTAAANHTTKTIDRILFIKYLYHRMSESTQEHSPDSHAGHTEETRLFHVSSEILQ